VEIKLMTKSEVYEYLKKMNCQNNEAILINNETVLPFDYFNDDTLELTNCADNETTKYFSFKIFTEEDEIEAYRTSLIFSFTEFLKVIADFDKKITVNQLLKLGIDFSEISKLTVKEIHDLLTLKLIKICSKSEESLCKVEE
jgi:sulfur carrier protein ThiS